MNNKYFITIEIETNQTEEELNKAIFQDRNIASIEAIGLTVFTNQNIPPRASRRKALLKRNEAIAQHIDAIKTIGPIE